MLRIAGALLLLLLLGGPAALAQVPDSGAGSLLVPAPAPDSAAALHRLFATQRANRALLVTGTVLAGGLTLALDGLFSSDSHTPLENAARKGQLLLLAVPGELALTDSYSRRDEELALYELQMHQLPNHLRRKLKPRYFQPAGLVRP